MAEVKQRRKVASDGGDDVVSQSEPLSSSESRTTATRVQPVVKGDIPSWDIATRHERFVPWVIFLVAAFTRFYRLDQPPGETCHHRSRRRAHWWRMH